MNAYFYLCRLTTNNTHVEQTKKDRKNELIAVGITGVLKFVLADWLQFKMFYIVAACLFWGFYIYKKYRKHPQILKFWGFQKKNFRNSFTFILPFAIAVGLGIFVYGIVVNARFFNWHVIPIILLYPAWGVIQQFMMLGLIGRNLKELKKKKCSDWQVIMAVSLVFSLVHYPSISLMMYVLVMEIIFGWAYFKWNNIWTLGLYHGWVSGFFIFFVLERDLWTELWSVFVS